MTAQPLIAGKQTTREIVMSEKLAKFIERYPNMTAEFREFIVEAVMDYPGIEARIAKRRRNRKAAAAK